MARPAVAGSPEIGVASNVGVDVMASTAPVRGSMATTAPMSGPSWRRGEVLQPLVHRQRQVPRPRLASQHVVHDVVDRIRIGLADQDVVPHALQAGRAEAQAGEPDEVGEGRVGVGAPAEAVDHLARGQDVAAHVEDRAARHGAPRHDHLRVVRPRGQRRGVHHLPPADRARHDGEGQHEVDGQPPGLDRDHGPRPSRSAATADRWLMASSSPMMMKLASRLDPP